MARRFILSASFSWVPGICQARLSGTEQQISCQLFENPLQTQKRLFSQIITKIPIFDKMAKNARIHPFINFIKMT
jgi:hypothetical protein